MSVKPEVRSGGPFRNSGSTQLHIPQTLRRIGASSPWSCGEVGSCGSRARSASSRRPWGVPGSPLRKPRFRAAPCNNCYRSLLRILPPRPPTPPLAILPWLAASGDPTMACGDPHRGLWRPHHGPPSWPRALACGEPTVAGEDPTIACGDFTVACAHSTMDVVGPAMAVGDPSMACGGPSRVGDGNTAAPAWHAATPARRAHPMPLGSSSAALRGAAGTFFDCVHPELSRSSPRPDLHRRTSIAARGDGGGAQGFGQGCRALRPHLQLHRGAWRLRVGRSPLTPESPRGFLAKGGPDYHGLWALRRNVGPVDVAMIAAGSCASTHVRLKKR